MVDIKKILAILVSSSFCFSCCAGALRLGGVIYSEQFLASRMELCLDPGDERFLYIVGYHIREVAPDIVTWLKRNATDCSVEFMDKLSASVEQKKWLAEVARIVISPYGNHLYCLALWSNALIWFSKNNATGALTFDGVIAKGQNGTMGLTGVWDLAIAKQSNRLLLLSSDTLTWYNLDTISGRPTVAGYTSEGFGRTQGSAKIATSMAVSDDGKAVYIGFRWPYSISWYVWQPIKKAYVFAGMVSVDSLVDRIPCDLILTPDGRHLYAAVKDVTGAMGRIDCFICDTVSGAPSLSFVAIDSSASLKSPIKQPHTLCLSPTLDVLYVGGSFKCSVAWMLRDRVSGQLNYGGVETSGADFAGPVSSIVASSGGHCVYAATPYQIYWFHVDTGVSVRQPQPSQAPLQPPARLQKMPLTDIRGRNVLASTLPQGVYLSGAANGRLILRKAFVR